MYESNISVSDFVDKVLTEVNAVPNFDPETVATILCDMQTNLYLHVIRPIKRVHVALKTEGTLAYFDTAEFESYIGEAPVHAEDVVLVCVSDKSIHFGTIEQFYSLSIPICCRMSNKIYVKNVNTQNVTVHYIVRPMPIGYQAIGGFTGNICMPQGYITLLEAGVLAELYRHIGDSEHCRIFSEKYNAALTDMKEHYRWIQGGDAG